MDDQLQAALEEIRFKAMEIRDIANRATEQGHLPGPKHQIIFDATGRILGVMAPHI